MYYERTDYQYEIPFKIKRNVHFLLMFLKLHASNFDRQVVFTKQGYAFQTGYLLYRHKYETCRIDIGLV